MIIFLCICYLIHCDPLWSIHVDHLPLSIFFLRARSDLPLMSPGHIHSGRISTRSIGRKKYLPLSDHNHDRQITLRSVRIICEYRLHWKMHTEKLIYKKYQFIKINCTTLIKNISVTSSVMCLRIRIDRFFVTRSNLEL